MTASSLAAAQRQYPLRAEWEGAGTIATRWAGSPSRFLADRTEAERAFALAERLGSVNAAAAELGTTWPSLRKAFARHGLGMPTRNPEAVRQRGDCRGLPAQRPAGGHPEPGPGVRVAHRDELPVRARSGGELAERVRRAEDYATLGAWVVVELHSESHAAKPTTRTWAITRRAQRAHRRQADRQQRGQRRHADRASRTDRPQRTRAQVREREVTADARRPP